MPVNLLLINIHQKLIFVFALIIFIFRLGPTNRNVSEVGWKAPTNRKHLTTRQEKKFIII